jgi:hypothetical protein
VGKLMSLLIWVLTTSALVIGCWFVKFKVCKCRGVKLPFRKHSWHFELDVQDLNVQFVEFYSWNLRSSFGTWDVYSPSMFRSVLHTLITRNLSSSIWGTSDSGYARALDTQTSVSGYAHCFTLSFSRVCFTLSNRDRNVHMIGNQLHPRKWI